MEKKEKLKKEFFERAPDIVARELLGKLVCRIKGKKFYSGIIVETESYFGENDPSSRAYRRKSAVFFEKMSSQPGILLIYMVHNNWLLNFVAHKKGQTGAVLVRAIEPVEGIEFMKKNRKREKLKELASGPGKFTQSFEIDKKFDRYDITEKVSKIYVLNTTDVFEIATSRRIGVSKDLRKHNRFFIKGNKFVSR
jgi:DNA-3-methyladenine glycosylase